MDRMNSGNFGIFYPNEFFSNLNKRIKSALEIIKNNSDISDKFWNSRIVN